MAKEIEFEGKIHSFPDDVTDEEINHALNKPVSAQELAFNQLKEKFPGMPESLMKGLISSVGTKPHPNLKKAADIAEPIGEAAQLAGISLLGGPEAAAFKALVKTAPKAISKAGDIAPIFKFIEKVPYKKLQEYMTEHNLGNEVKISPEKLNEAKRLLQSKGIDLPEEAIERAFLKAEAGNHKSIHNIQSSVRSAGRKLSKKGGVEADLGNDMYKLAEEIFSQHKQHYENAGHPKASELMSQGKLRSARYHKLSPYQKVVSGVSKAAGIPAWILELLK